MSRCYINRQRREARQADTTRPKTPPKLHPFTAKKNLVASMPSDLSPRCENALHRARWCRALPLPPVLILNQVTSLHITILIRSNHTSCVDVHRLLLD